MLQALREKSSGWIATVVLGLLIVPFAFFGMEQYLFQQNDTHVARIQAPPAWWPGAPEVWPVTLLWQREDVSDEEFRTAFQQARQRASQEDAENYDARAFESVENKRRVLDELIDQRLLKMLAEREGIQVGDAQVRRAIEQIPAFQADGRFNAQRYQQALASQVPARRPVEFQQLMREGLQQAVMPEALARSAFVTPSEVNRLLTLLGETRDVTFALIAPQVDATAPVSDAQIEQWYQAHKAEFRAPEMVTLQYVEVTAADVSAEPIDEAALRARYEQQKATLGEPERRQVSHILVEVPASADQATQDAAKAEADRIAAQARQAGADFAALAREHSDDAGSKASGGDLGWIARDGAMVKPFEDAVFAMQPGTVSDPVRSQFGWHVIQLREVQAGQVQSFEDVREQLATQLQQTGHERAFNELMGRVVDEVYKNPGTLEGAAALLGKPVATTAPFARGMGEGIAAEQAVERLAFDTRMIEDGTVSEPIELGENRSVLIRVAKHVPEQAQPVTQVREQVAEAIRLDRASKAAEQTAKTVIEEVQAGKTLADVATARNLPLQQQPSLQRGVPMVDPGLMEAVFQTQPPAEGNAPTLGQSSLPGGAVAVFAVNGVTRGDPAQAPQAERDMLSNQLAQIDGINASRALVDALRGRSRVTVVEERL